MSYQCPKCNSVAYVIRSRVASNGCRVRRYRCISQACLHRWTDYIGERPIHSRQANPTKPRLSDEQVRIILTRRDLTQRHLGKQYNRSAQAIGAVRLGRAYADVLPEIPRWTAVDTAATCLKCSRWTDKRCRLGFPDPEIEGPRFARECNNYDPS